MGRSGPLSPVLGALSSEAQGRDGEAYDGAERVEREAERWCQDREPQRADRGEGDVLLTYLRRSTRNVRGILGHTKRGDETMNAVARLPASLVVAASDGRDC